MSEAICRKAEWPLACLDGEVVVGYQLRVPTPQVVQQPSVHLSPIALRHQQQVQLHLQTIELPLTGWLTTTACCTDSTPCARPHFGTWQTCCTAASDQHTIHLSLGFINSCRDRCTCSTQPLL